MSANMEHLLEDDVSSEEDGTTVKRDFIVTADVHAQMDFEPVVPIFDVDTTESLFKLPQRRLIENKPDVDEIFPIKDNVKWKIVSKNLEEYRINNRRQYSRAFNESHADDDAPLPKYTKKTDDETPNKSFLTNRPVISSHTGLQRTVRNDGFIKRTEHAIGHGPKRIGDRMWNSFDKNPEHSCVGIKISKRSEDGSSDKEPEHDENQQSISKHSPTNSNVFHDDSEKSDLNHNTLSTENKNTYSKKQPKMNPLNESNRSNPFDEIVSSPSYHKGQLNSSASYSYRKYYMDQKRPH